MDRGQGVPFLVKIVIALAVILVAYFLIDDVFSGTVNTVDPYMAAASWESCKAQGEMWSHEGRNFGDCDMDGFPDSCDNCIDGDNTDDYDGDGMPDACEQLATRDDPDRILCMFKVKGKENTCGKGPEGDALDDYNDMKFDADAESEYEALGDRYKLGSDAHKCPSGEDKKEWIMVAEGYKEPE